MKPDDFLDRSKGLIYPSEMSKQMVYYESDVLQMIEKALNIKKR